MKRVYVALVGLLLSSCQWVPGTDANKIETGLRRLRDAEPGAAPREVWRRDNVICGSFEKSGRPTSVLFLVVDQTVKTEPLPAETTEEHLARAAYLTDFTKLCYPSQSPQVTG